MKISNVETLVLEDAITLDVGGSAEELNTFVTALESLRLEANFVHPPKTYLTTIFGTLKITQKRDLTGLGGIEAKQTEIKAVL